MESSNNHLAWYEKGHDYLDLFVRVTPHARISGIVLDLEDARSHKVKIGVNVAPEGGKANKAVIDLLSNCFHYRKSDFHVYKGALKRDKTIRISGNPEDLFCLIFSILKQPSHEDKKS
jgi:uncharacterized protein (TIGR00251 family)